MRAFICILTLTGLAACGGDGSQLMNLDAGQRSPDEFQVLPTKPLTMPDNLAVLPQPTPGGDNLTDPTPFADAVGALGGNPAALADQGVSASDQVLVAYAARGGTDPVIRQRLAQEDSEWRSRHSRRLLERLAQTNVYLRAYSEMTLDSHAELQRWQRAGAQVPSAPPVPEE